MPSQKMITPDDEMELESWRQATLVVLLLAALVFFVQRLFGPIFEVAFEICIFHIPAVTIVLLYLYIDRAKLSAKSRT